jgi:protein SCO1
MMRRSAFSFAVLIAFLSVTGSSQAFTQASRAKPEVGVEEHLGTTIPLDAEFYDEHGNLTPLRSVIDKPTVLMFVYFRCPGICSPLLTEVSRIVDGLDLELGKDYQLVTIGFDHREKFDMAASKKESYLASMKHKVNPAGWRWFTGDSATIQRVTDSAGFYFKRDGNDYIHAGVLIVLSPTGKITRYLNGVQFLPFDVKMAVAEAAEGRTGPTIAKLLKFCYRYDPEGRTYALNVTRVSGVVIVVLVAVFVGLFVIRPKKKRAEERQ